MDFQNKRVTSEAELNQLLASPGQLIVHVHQLQGTYIPFFFFMAPDSTEQVPYGPLMHEQCVVAAAELDELLDALYESFGGDVVVYAPASPTRPKVTFH